jgi:hypothetical protein
MATKARLHWFWRGLIAVSLAAISNVFILGIAGRIRQQVSTNVLLIIVLLVTPIPGIIIYGLYTRHFGPPPPDGELHCRRCNHILRGLSEPRCPECGEPI